VNFPDGANNPGRALSETHRALARKGFKAKLILQVHDELVLEVPDGEIVAVREQLPKLMGGVAKLAVPLLVEVGVGPNWDQAH
jgi:DNA polymerase-1